MTLLDAESQSCDLIDTPPAGTDQPEQGRGRRTWRAFLMTLLRALYVWTV